MNPQATKLKALANTHRIKIINKLLDGEMNVGQLNKFVKVSQPALSQHLAKLRKAGWLGSRLEQRQIYYYIADIRAVRILEDCRGR